MLYTTQAELEIAISETEFLNLFTDGTVYDEDIAEQVNQAAVNYLHYKLGGLYVTPFNAQIPNPTPPPTTIAQVVPPIIVDWTHKLMVYFAWYRRDSATIPDRVQENFEMITRELDKAASGVGNIVGARKLAENDEPAGQSRFVYKVQASEFDNLP